MIKTKEFIPNHMSVDDMINNFISMEEIKVIDIKYLEGKSLLIYDDGYR
jgi:hypothetical protein